MAALCTETIRGLFTLAAVIVAAEIAKRTYFRQKDYEVTKQRYLDNGVDQVEISLQNALGVLSHNFARALELCRAFRDRGELFNLSELEKGFVPYEQQKFQQVAQVRVGTLIGSSIVWEVCQLAFAQIDSSNSTISSEVPNAIKAIHERRLPLAEREQAAKEMLGHLREAHDSNAKYSIILTEVHKLGLLLENEKLSHEAVSKFQSREEVKAIVASLKEGFQSEISALQAE